LQKEEIRVEKGEGVGRWRDEGGTFLVGGLDSPTYLAGSLAKAGLELQASCSNIPLYDQVRGTREREEFQKPGYEATGKTRQKKPPTAQDSTTTATQRIRRTIETLSKGPSSGI